MSNHVDQLDDDDKIPMTGGEMEKIISLALQPRIMDIEASSTLTTDELVQRLLEQLPSGERLVLDGEYLKHIMSDRYLPHEDVYAYREMEENALLAVDDLAMVPVELRDKARKLRGRQRTMQGLR